MPSLHPFMPCSAYASSALGYFLTVTDAARTIGNAQPIRAWKHQCCIKSYTLRNEPTPICGIRALQLLQIAGFHTYPSPVHESRQRKEPPHRDRYRSAIGVADPIRIHKNVGGAPQTAKVPAASRSRKDSMQFEGFHEPRPLQKSEASFDHNPLKETVVSTGHRDARFGSWEDSPRKTSPENFNQKRIVCSSRSTKELADHRNGARNYKDRREEWQIQKSALSEKFGSAGWMPRKRLSPDTLEGIRALHAQYPDKFTTPILADQFKVSPEAIRRILKSKWRPSEEEEDRRRQRWEKRGENIWSQKVEVGIKPPKKWRDLGVGKHDEGKAFRS